MRFRASIRALKLLGYTCALTVIVPSTAVLGIVTVNLTGLLAGPINPCYCWLYGTPGETTLTSLRTASCKRPSPGAVATPLTCRKGGGVARVKLVASTLIVWLVVERPGSERGVFAVGRATVRALSLKSTIDNLAVEVALRVL